MYWIALQPRPDGEPPVADATTALGWWALQFTPKVARLEHAVLLEVSTSERLFGGRQTLVDIFSSSTVRLDWLKLPRLLPL